MGPPMDIDILNSLEPLNSEEQQPMSMVDIQAHRGVLRCVEKDTIQELRPGTESHHGELGI